MHSRGRWVDRLATDIVPTMLAEAPGARKATICLITFVLLIRLTPHCTVACRPLQSPASHATGCHDQTYVNIPNGKEV